MELKPNSSATKYHMHTANRNYRGRKMFVMCLVADCIQYRAKANSQKAKDKTVQSLPSNARSKTSRLNHPVPLEILTEIVLKCNTHHEMT
jgi:hypothetical protein